MSSESLEEFSVLIESIDQLVDIHGRIQDGRGRRHRQDAIHRAGVVLAVAAWQAYIEKISSEALEFIGEVLNVRPNGRPTPAWVKSSFSFRKPAIRKTIGDLNTPNAQNVQRVLNWSFGFDPWPFWQWNQGLRNWSTQDFVKRTDEWLRIRHTIAHGTPLPDNLLWLKNSGGDARLNLALLKECAKHFTKLAELTDDAFADFIALEYRSDRPW
jgi:hypothetical protein